MPLRRVLVVGGIAVVIAAVAGGIALSAGPEQHVRQAYAGQRTFVSKQLDVCVVATIRGTAVGTRSGAFPLVRWTGVRLLDPTMTAAGYAVAAGRCDRSHPVGLAADLEQHWSGSGGRAEVRRSFEGPSTGTLRQFSSGTPVDLPDRGFPASVLDPGYAITGQVLVDARERAGSEGFAFSLHLALAPRGH